MRKITSLSLICLASLTLAISCSKKTVPPALEKGKGKVTIENNTTPACTERLIEAMGYSLETFTERLMTCNILKIQSLDESIRKIKGQRRLEIVYLNVKCDEISRMLSQYELECKKDLTLTGL